MSTITSSPAIGTGLLNPSIFKRRFTVQPGENAQSAGLRGDSLQPLTRGLRNPLWSSRLQALAPRVSALLSGSGLAAQALSGRMFCSSGGSGTLGRIGDFFKKLVGRSDTKPTSSDNTQTITFVHVNDIHARFTPEADGGNPLARMRGYYNYVRDNENPQTIFTHGGDVYEKGDITELITKGYTTRAAFEAVGFDIAVIGNHDFAWSAEEVLAYSRAPNTVMLGSNIKYVGDDPSEYGGVEYYIKKVGQINVAFIGDVPTGYDERDDHTDIEYYPEKLATKHDDYEGDTRKRIKKLREEENVDMVVLLSHLGIETDRKLAKNVEGIDVILSSHSHDAIKEVVNGVPIIQADAYSRLIGRLDVEWDLEKGRIVDHSMKMIKNDSSVPTDQAVADKINAIVQAHLPEDADNVAQLSQSLEDKEALAELALTSALHHIENARAAMLDEKMVWLDSWDPGSITLNQLARTYEVERELAGTPGFNSFYTVDVTGAELTLIRTSGLWSGRNLVHAGVDNPDPDQTYTLALPKKYAMHLDHYFNIPQRECTAVCEIWEAVYAYGQHRTAEGKYIDDDRPLDNGAIV